MHVYRLIVTSVCKTYNEEMRLHSLEEAFAYAQALDPMEWTCVIVDDETGECHYLDEEAS